MRIVNPSPHVLVIDDEPVLCRNAVTMLCRAGYVARASGSLTHALEQLSANPPDLVCLDIRLPDGDGLCGVVMIKDDTEETGDDEPADQIKGAVQPLA